MNQSAWLALLLTADVGCDSSTPQASSTTALHVRVVDGDGRPQPGVPVALCRLDEEPGSKGAVVRSTSSEGVADFEEELRNHGAAANSPLRIVSADVLSISPPEMVVDLSSPRRSPVELRLPPGRPVRLRLVDADGHPVVMDAEGSAGAMRRVVEVATRFDVGLESTRRLAGPARFEMRSGHARLPFVEDGAELEVSLKRTSAAPVRGSFVVVGDSPEPQFDLVLPAPGPFLEGRFVVAPGSIVDVTRFDVHIKSFAVHAGLEELLFSEPSDEDATFAPRIDPDGRFRIDIAGWIGGFSWITVRFRDPGGSVLAAWRREIDRRAKGSLAVGDVRIEEPRRIATGRVVDDAGRPVAGAVVRANAHLSESGLDDSAIIDNLECFESRSADDGTFVAYAPFEPHDVRVIVSAPGFVTTDSQLVESASTSIPITLSRTGAIEGRLLLPDRAAAAACSSFVAWQSSSEENDADESDSDDEATIEREGEARAEVSSDGRFELKGVAPGRRVVVVEIDGASGMRRHRAPPIVVEPGRTAELAPIDLRSEPIRRFVALLPVDASGSLLTHRPPFHVDAAGQRLFRSNGTSARNARIGPGSATFDVVVDGWRSQRVERVAADRVVVLAPGIPIEVEVASSSPRTGARVAIAPLDGAGEPRSDIAVQAPLDARGVATFRLCDPGPHVVAIFEPPPRSPDAAEAESVAWPQLELRERGASVFESHIVVADSASPQRFHLEVEDR